MGIFKAIKALIPAGLPATASSGVPAMRPERNDLCWCGSGKKYKKCHLEADERKLKPAACYGPT